MDGVQSFGEKRAFGEKIGRLCLSAIQSRMKNRCCYWAKLPANSSREHAASGNLAEGEGFELAVCSFGRVVNEWRFRISKKPFFEPLCRPTLPITLLGVDVRRIQKNTV